VSEPPQAAHGPPASGGQTGSGETGSSEIGSGEIGYGEAVSELEAILSRLEHDDVDVDVLAAEVRRAAELIALCRDRIQRARTEVERVVTQLGEAEG
jgi:exodeoxyribonuclease VII small subunit